MNITSSFNDSAYDKIQKRSAPGGYIEPTPVNESEYVKKELQKWSATAGQAPADEIWDAYINKKASLVLKGYNLPKLPDVIGYLTELEEVTLEGNRLTSLPETMGKLTKLQRLHLNNNELSEIPKSIGDLVNLKELILHNNKLTKLPETIVKLNNLKTLILHHNNLAELPENIGGLSNLKSLSIRSNPNLKAVPRSLENCSEIINITGIEETQINRLELDLILQRCQEKRMKQLNLLLQTYLDSWNFCSRGNYDFSFINQFTETEKNMIGEWLLRLERCQDFLLRRKELATLVCKMLTTLGQSKPFKESFFAELTGNLKGCGDMASMLLNVIYTDWLLYTVDQNAPVPDLLKHMAEVARTLTLRLFILKKIDAAEKIRGSEYSECVEIFFYYENQLKEHLKLATQIENMQFKAIGNRPDIVNIDELVEYVENHYMDTLANFTCVDSILMRLPEYASEKAEIDKEAYRKLEIDAENASKEREGKTVALRKKFLDNFLK